MTWRNSASAASRLPFSSSALLSAARRVSSLVPRTMASPPSPPRAGKRFPSAPGQCPGGGSLVERRDESADLPGPTARPERRKEIHSPRDVTPPEATSDVDPRCPVQCLVDLPLGRRIMGGLLPIAGSSGAGELRRGLMPERLACCQTTAEVLGTARGVRRWLASR